MRRGAGALGCRRRYIVGIVEEGFLLKEVSMLPYLMICVSVVFEVFADTMMKLSDGFRRKLPIVGVVVGYVISFWMMSQVLLELPLGPVYAAWTGLGIALTAVVGAILWAEGMNAKKIAGLIAIIAGVVLLKLGV